MRGRLIISVLFFMLSLTSKASPVLATAQSSFDQFKSCLVEKSESAFELCLKNNTDSKISQDTRSRLAMYLVQDYRFSSLRECTSADKLQVFERKSDHVYFCLDVLGSKFKLQGYVDFSRKTLTPKVSAIRYSH